VNVGAISFFSSRISSMVHIVSSREFVERNGLDMKASLLQTDTGSSWQLYERGAYAVKLPMGGPKLGGDVLIMGFPQCEDCFFLCLQLDVNFTPLFTLLEAHPQSSSARSTLVSGAFDIFRWMKIDIEAMPILRENTGFSLLEQGGYEAKGSAANMVVKRLEDETYGKFGVPPMIRGPSRAGGLGLDGVQAGLEPYYGADKGIGHRGTMLAVQSPSNLQGGSPLQHGSSPLQHGSVGYGINSGSNMNPLISAAGYHQGKSLSGSPTFGDGNHRLGRASMVNGTSPHNLAGVSPLRSSMDIRNQMSHRKSPLQGASDQELLSTRSPLAMGDNAASPIELDDEHISKLIDSISSKTPGSFTTTDSPSRQGRHIPQPRSGIVPSNSRPLIGKVGSPSGSQLARSSGLAQASSPGWKSTVSGSVSFNTDSGSSIQEWTDLEQQGRLGGSLHRLSLSSCRVEVSRVIGSFTCEHLHAYEWVDICICAMLVMGRFLLKNYGGFSIVQKEEGRGFFA
jgi:hypothetical protein